MKAEKEKVDKELSKTQGKANQIYYYRFIKGLTQEQTAEKLDMSSRQVQRIEQKLKS